MLTMIAGWLGKSILMQSRIGKLIRLVPKEAWIALALLVAAWASYRWHQHKVHQLVVSTQRAQMAADNDHWKAKLAQAHRDALNWKTRYETAQQAIANEERAHHEENLRNDAALADALSLRGPGAAASRCGPVGSSGTASSTGGRLEAAAQPDAAGRQVPAGDWAVVPWSWLVKRAQEHDDSVSENVAWRNQHARQQKLHDDSVAKQPR